MTNYHTIFTVSIFSTILPFWVSTIFIKYFKVNKSLLLCWIFFAFAAITEIVLYVFSLLSKQSTWIFHLYTLIEYTLIAGILANWQAKPVIAKMIRIGILVYAPFFIFLKMLGVEDFSAGTVNYVTRPLALLLLATFAFITLRVLWNQTSINLTDNYRFWMLLAMVFYYSTSLVLFAFMFTKNNAILVALFKIHAVANITRNLLFTISVFQLRKAQQTAIP